MNALAMWRLCNLRFITVLRMPIKPASNVFFFQIHRYKQQTTNIASKVVQP
jgi:hypothetical protein